MIRTFRLWLLNREIDRALTQRRNARKFRSEAAQRGFSTHCKRRGEQCRALFGAGA